MISGSNQVSLEDFFNEFEKKKKRILFLDYDGTISPFTANRDNAKPYEGVIPRLETLIQSPHTRLIIISGRTIEMLKRLLALSHYPELIGGHGAEHLIPGQKQIKLEISKHAVESLEKATKWTYEMGFNKYCEFKPSAIAFHWRGLPSDDKVKIEQNVRRAWQDKKVETELEIHEFNGGMELRYAKVNKGDAVKRVLKETGFNFLIAYLGDDQTDEEAFEALGDQGLKVLVGNDLRPTMADFIIAPPDGVLSFLDNWISADK